MMTVVLGGQFVQVELLRWSEAAPVGLGRSPYVRLPDGRERWLPGSWVRS